MWCRHPVMSYQRFIFHKRSYDRKNVQLFVETHIQKNLGQPSTHIDYCHCPTKKATNFASTAMAERWLSLLILQHMNKLVSHVRCNLSFRTFNSVHLLGVIILKLESKYQLTVNSKSLLPTGMTVPFVTSLCVFPTKKCKRHVPNRRPIHGT